MIVTNVRSAHNGIGLAYIYIWVSKSTSVLYVGMTNNEAGPIGRANGHFIRNGSFRKRFDQYRGYGIENISDLILISFPLPKELKYISVESSYRESVEYLVQKELQVMRGSLSPSFDVVSWHDRFPKRTGNSEVISIANGIVDSFKSIYGSL